jgi:hypothetical protein
MIALNIVFAIFVIAMVVTPLVWAIRADRRANEVHTRRQQARAYGHARARTARRSRVAFSEN